MRITFYNSNNKVNAELELDEIDKIGTHHVYQGPRLQAVVTADNLDTDALVRFVLKHIDRKQVFIRADAYDSQD